MAKVPNSVLDLLIEMISFDTVNEQISERHFPEKKMMEQIESYALQWGFQVSRLPIANTSANSAFNLLITYEAYKDAPWLLFESHADTVDVKNMTVNPFIAEVIDGKLYGRGACDTKGSGASMLWALQKYSQGVDKPNNIALLFVTDEEISKTGANSFVGAQLPQLPWKPVGVIVGEPTMCKVIVAHNGVLRWKIRTKGVAAHSSNPANGRSAISAMAKLILEFERIYCAETHAIHPLTGRSACSVNTINGGSAVNIIPSNCEIEIDRRILPGEDPLDVRKSIQAVLDSICLADSSIEVETSEPFIDFPLDPLSNVEFAAQISKSLDSLGFADELLGVAYGTDASTYSFAGLSAVVIGPGSIDQAHTKDEWIELQELDKAVVIYEQFMKANYR
ncbi:MAG: M20/M25/M40 family metallo-hydrolase [Actinobacteria bacterium]|uniref:Unannotated protein n=1 Tax=freshwater metagenome TaxID=449393 RepID=A0A6J6VR73_9ZZZZ|nr:M20/M25/M40 family metallo-hydrolase [Actinomycetota bacterium]MSY67753.1 M20/M25/M40 family metallo-hydrolase [Actinomycetota bacterium]MTA01392.1 M20/M25/M40 family metallo-hydrolase [Actinomycetota bacterium]